MDSRKLASALQGLYDQVPATRCAQSGECCALTNTEYEVGYATMFPLYLAEYINIVGYVKRKFSGKRRQALLAHTEERPRKCPFLGDGHACTIYPVRPLICRTYAVMNHQTIEEAAQKHRGSVPKDWIEGFVLRESGMVCPRVVVVEPEKLARHSQNLIENTYESELIGLSRQLELTGPRRKGLLARLVGWRHWPLRWTWGGFNAVHFATGDWLRRRFKEYWKKAELGDLR